MSYPEHTPPGDQALLVLLVPYARLSHCSWLKQRSTQDSTPPSALDPVFTIALKLGSSKHIKTPQPIFTIISET